MVYNFENYTPLFDETEFNDHLYIQTKKPYKPSSKLCKTTATILSSLNQKINTDLLTSYLVHPDVTIIKPKKDIQVFFNQITVSIRIITRKNETRYINTKIFGAGTIQMTGGKSINEAKQAISTLVEYIRTLRIRVKIDGEQTYKHPKYIYAVNDIDSLNMDNIIFEYKMNNSSMKFQEYDFGTLYNTLRDLKYDVRFNPTTYAGIIYKTKIEGIDATFILFRSGKSTISLGSDVSIKKKAFKFMNDIIKEHYDTIAPTTYDLPVYK